MHIPSAPAHPAEAAIPLSLTAGEALPVSHGSEARLLGIAVPMSKAHISAQDFSQSGCPSLPTTFVNSKVI